MGDFSNGNDAVILKGKDKLSDIKGQKVNLVEFSVSPLSAGPRAGEHQAHRARREGGEHLGRRHGCRLQDQGRDLGGDVEPLVSEILAEKSAKSVFDSSRSPARSWT